MEVAARLSRHFSKRGGGAASPGNTALPFSRDRCELCTEIEINCFGRRLLRAVLRAGQDAVCISIDAFCFKPDEVCLMRDAVRTRDDAL